MTAYIKVKTNQQELEELNASNLKDVYTELGKLFNLKVHNHSIYVKPDKSMEIELEGRLIK